MSTDTNKGGLAAVITVTVVITFGVSEFIIYNLSTRFAVIEIEPLISGYSVFVINCVGGTGGSASVVIV